MAPSKLATVAKYASLIINTLFLVRSHRGRGRERVLNERGLGREAEGGGRREGDRAGEWRRGEKGKGERQGEEQEANEKAKGRNRRLGRHEQERCL